MSKSKVTITGAGGGINYEVAIIVAALRMEGFEVEVVNEYPPENQEELVTRRRSLRYCDKNRKDEVIVVAEHLPWGG